MTLSAGTGRAEEIDPRSADEERRTGAVLVDVREPDEWAAGRAAGAVHLPLGQLATRLEELPPGGELLFICHSGQRSLAAAELVITRGRTARSVRGGTVAWAKAGLPLER
jgi:rhodanese-related sulfurtransferase